MRGLRRFAVVPVLLALAALLPACGADRDPGVVRLTPIDPTLTAQSLDSVDAAFVDDTFAVPAELTADDVIYTDDPQRPELTQYINIFAVRAEGKGDPTLLVLAQLYHDPAVAAAIRAESGDDGIFKYNEPAELRAPPAELEATFRDRSGPR
ncbi:MetQ/NlpA family ABC transporter substrate-binding protein [Nocardia rhamnosiphila]|uniref:MetQ/NlpA family ABC transporter substrate-binding protein n=1 Tax=Nocardia rhamnosiphila TaxID=426716 RepID=A0ABV2WLB8_9NOCA